MRDSRKAGKIPWRGQVNSIQPRIRLRRSFDQRDHSYHGFVLGIEGTLGPGKDQFFLIAIGEGAQDKHLFRAGDIVSGVSVPVEDPELETASYYKTSALKLIERSECPAPAASAPPYQGFPPELKTYRTRGHRRLEAETYASKCTTCIWGCRMSVEIIRDHWNRSRDPDNVTRRFETFCYGPADCAFYKAGPKRKVRGRKGMVTEDDGDSRPEAVH